MAKVVMQGSTVISANSSNANVLTGQKYERPPGDAIGTLYVTGSATGLSVELNCDGKAISDTIQVNVQNRIPVVPDDMLIDGWEAFEGKLIQLKAINSTAGALTLFWRVELQEAMFSAE